ncbi:hypothetical protein GCM10009605_41970 [Nocardiopsis composta]
MRSRGRAGAGAGPGAGPGKKTPRATVRVSGAARSERTTNGRPVSSARRPGHRYGGENAPLQAVPDQAGQVRQIRCHRRGAALVRGVLLFDPAAARAGERGAH